MSHDRSEGKERDREPEVAANKSENAKGRQREDNLQRDAEIERMIEAKVSQALRLMH